MLLSPYELQRLETIGSNNAILKSLGIQGPLLTEEPKPKRVRVPKLPAEATRASTRETKRPSTYGEECATTYETIMREENTRRQRTVIDLKMRANREPKARSSIPPGKRLSIPASWLPSLGDYADFSGCTDHARQRHKHSKTNSYSQIDPTIKAEVLAQLPNQELPRVDKSNQYKFVQRIENKNGWHYRSTFGNGDYGTFCEPELAAFVSHYGNQHRELSVFQVWAKLGIIDLTDLLNSDQAKRVRPESAAPASAAAPATSEAPSVSDQECEYFADTVMAGFLQSYDGHDDEDDSQVFTTDDLETEANSSSSMEVVCSSCGVILIDLKGTVLPSIHCPFMECSKVVCHPCAGFVNTPSSNQKWVCAFHKCYIRGVAAA